MVTRGKGSLEMWLSLGSWEIILDYKVDLNVITRVLGKRETEGKQMAEGEEGGEGSKGRKDDVMEGA